MHIDNWNTSTMLWFFLIYDGVRMQGIQLDSLSVYFQFQSCAFFTNNKTFRQISVLS